MIGEDEVVDVKLTLGIKTPRSTLLTSKIADASAETPVVFIDTPLCEKMLDDNNKHLTVIRTVKNPLKIFYFVFFIKLKF